jgi:hypothetical protein
MSGTITPGPFNVKLIHGLCEHSLTNFPLSKPLLFRGYVVFELKIEFLKIRKDPRNHPNEPRQFLFGRREFYTQEFQKFVDTLEPTTTPLKYD